MSLTPLEARNTDSEQYAPAGTDPVSAIAAANEAERLAADLDRRGGGLTSRAADLAGEHAAKIRREMFAGFGWPTG